MAESTGDHCIENSARREMSQLHESETAGYSSLEANNVAWRCFRNDYRHHISLTQRRV